MVVYSHCRVEQCCSHSWRMFDSTAPFSINQSSLPKPTSITPNRIKPVVQLSRATLGLLQIFILPLKNPLRSSSILRPFLQLPNQSSQLPQPCPQSSVVLASSLQLTVQVAQLCGEGARGRERRWRLVGHLAVLVCFGGARVAVEGLVLGHLLSSSGDAVEGFSREVTGDHGGYIDV